MTPFAWSPRRALCAAIVVVFAGSVVPSVGAQAPAALQGRVLLDEAPVAGAAIEVHRVTRDTAGVVARAVTGADGAFRTDLPAADPEGGFTVFFATAEHHGIRYFGSPLHPGDALDGYTIAVHDTLVTRAADAPIRVLRRDMVLLPEPQGGWEVNEIVQLVNEGNRTLIPAGDEPIWEFRIPRDAFAFEVGEGELDARGFARMEDRVMLVEPLVPGPREVFVRYRVAGAETEFQVAALAPTHAFNLMIAEPAPAVTVDGLAAADAVRAEGRTFRMYRAVDLEAGSAIRVQWARGGPPVDPNLAALAVLGTMLLIGAAAAVRGTRRGREPGDGERGRADDPAEAGSADAETGAEPPRQLVS